MLISRECVLDPLYGHVEALEPRKHRNLRLRRMKDARFTARHNWFPLSVHEFNEAARWHPIVFTRIGARRCPVMVTQARPGWNGALDEAGQWRDQAYLPNHVRRYPFLLLASSDGSRLGIDPHAPHFSETEGDALFEDGLETPRVASIRAFCEAVERDWLETQAMLSALEHHGLLLQIDATPSVTFLRDLPFGPFEIVDTGRLASLPGDVLRDAMARGWISAIEAHRASLLRWADL